MVVSLKFGLMRNLLMGKLNLRLKVMQLLQKELLPC